MKILEPHGLIDNLYKYVQTNIELVKVEVRDQIEQTIRRIMLVLPMVILISTALVFVLISLALYLNQVLDSHFVGFLIVAGISLLASAVLGYIFWKQLPKKEAELADNTANEKE